MVGRILVFSLWFLPFGSSLSVTFYGEVARALFDTYRESSALIRRNSLCDFARLLGMRDAVDLALAVGETLSDPLPEFSLIPEITDHLPSVLARGFAEVISDIPFFDMPSARKALISQIPRSVFHLSRDADSPCGENLLEIFPHSDFRLARVLGFASQPALNFVRPVPECLDLREKFPIAVFRRPEDLLDGVARSGVVWNIGENRKYLFPTSKWKSVTIECEISDHLRRGCRSRTEFPVDVESTAIMEAHGRSDWTISDYMTAFTAGSEEISPDMVFVNALLVPDSANLLVDSLGLNHHSVKLLFMTFTNFENFILLINKLSRFPYVLHSVDVDTAIFVRKEISDSPAVDPEIAWMQGFYCNPLAVEVFPGFFRNPEIPFDARYLDRFNSGYNAGLRIAASENRAHCFAEVCECVPPWRGFLCERRDEQVRDTQSLAIYFLVTAATVGDLKKSLKNLHENFNKHFGHPVVVFYDTPLDERTRRDIFRASENPVWLVQSFSDLHPHKFPDSLSTAASHTGGFGAGSVHPRSAGYRSICRFESGPVFLHPAVKNFRRLMRLDTDGYFTFDARHVDVERHFRRESETVLLVSGLVAVSGSRVNHLDEVISAFHKETQPGRNLTIDRFSDGFLVTANSPPYVFDVKFFQSDEYQKYWRTLDAMDGFRNLGWLGNAVLSAGVEIFGKKFGVLIAPTAHQVVCACDEARAGVTEHVCVAAPGNDETSEVRWRHARGHGVWQCRHESEIAMIADKCKPYNRDNLVNEVENHKYLWCDQ